MVQQPGYVANPGTAQAQCTDTAEYHASDDEDDNDVPAPSAMALAHPWNPFMRRIAHRIKLASNFGPLRTDRVGPISPRKRFHTAPHPNRDISFHSRMISRLVISRAIRHSGFSSIPYVGIRELLAKRILHKSKEISQARQRRRLNVTQEGAELS